MRHSRVVRPRSTSTPVGWRNFSREHALAARGVSTRKYAAVKGPQASSSLRPMGYNDAWGDLTHFPEGPSRSHTIAKPVRKEVLVGGAGDGRPDSDFDPEQLRKGIEEEMEHTSDPNVAKEIAKDHITKNKDAYREPKKEGVAFFAKKDQELDIDDDMAMVFKSDEQLEKERKARKLTSDVLDHWISSLEADVIGERTKADPDMDLNARRESMISRLKAKKKHHVAGEGGYV